MTFRNRTTRRRAKCQPPAVVNWISLRLAGACIALAASAALSHATPAWACECGEPVLSEAFGAADAVFAGSVLEIQDFGFGPYAAGTILKVESVWKGEAATTAILVSGTYDAETGEASESSCDYSFRDDVRYLVFARNHNDYLYADFCSGTESWTQDSEPDLLGALVAAYGEGHAPDKTLSTPVVLESPPPLPNTPAAYPDSPRKSSDASSPVDPVASDSPLNPVWLLFALTVAAGFIAVTRRRKPSD